MVYEFVYLPPNIHDRPHKEFNIKTVDAIRYVKIK